MSIYDFSRKQSDVERADKLDNGKSRDTVAEFVNSTVYAAIEEPARAVAQLADHVFGTKYDQAITSDFAAIGIGASQKAEFASPGWYAQQLGGAIGMMAPFMALRGRVGAGASKLFGEQAIYGGLHEVAGGKALLGIAGKEAALSGASGFLYGGLLSPSDEQSVGKQDFVWDRAKNAAGDLIAFGTIGFTNPYLTSGFGAAANAVDKFSLAPTAKAATVGLLRGPLLPGVASGVPAGLVNAEVGAWKDGRLVASGDEFKENIAGMAFVGGTLGTAHWLGEQRADTNATNARYLTDRIGLTQADQKAAAQAEFRVVKGDGEYNQYYNDVLNGADSAKTDLIVRQRINGVTSAILGDTFKGYGATRPLSLWHGAIDTANISIAKTRLIGTCSLLEGPLSAHDVFPGRNKDNATVWLNPISPTRFILNNAEHPLAQDQLPKHQNLPAEPVALGAKDSAVKEVIDKTIKSDIVYDAATRSAKVNPSQITTNELCQFLKNYPDLAQLEVSFCDNLKALPLEHLTNLRKLDVSQCNNLKELPLQHLTNLQKLTVGNCDNLKELPLQGLTNLQDLSVWGCSNLRELPLQHLTNLQKFSVSQCNNIKELPLEHLTNLQTLDVSYCDNIKELPLQHLTNLQKLNIQHCDNIKELPLEHLTNLQEFQVVSCDNIEKLPLEHLTNLQTLDVSYCDNIKELPLQHLTNLQKLNVGFYYNLKELPLPPGLTSLILHDLASLTTLPAHLPSGLKKMVLDHCPKLESLPKDLPAGLQVTIDGCDLLEANANVQKTLGKQFDSQAKRWSADNVRVTAEMLKDAADAIEELVPENGTCVLLGRDSFPLVPLLRHRGVDARYFIWSRLQIGDEATASLWRQEVPADAIVIDTGYAGSILDDIKKIDPTIKGYLMSSTGLYPEIPGLELDRGELVQYIERFPKAVGRGVTISRGAPVCRAENRDGEEKIFSPRQSMDLTKQLFLEMGLPEEIAEQHKTFTGMTKEERIGLWKYYIPSGKETADRNLPNFWKGRSPHLYAGGQPTEAGMRKLKNLGVHTIVDLRSNPGTAAAIGAEALGIRYIDLPTSSRCLTPEQLQVFMNELKSAKSDWIEHGKVTTPAIFYITSPHDELI